MSQFHPCKRQRPSVRRLRARRKLLDAAKTKIDNAEALTEEESLLHDSFLVNVSEWWGDDNTNLRLDRRASSRAKLNRTTKPQVKS